MIKMTGRKLAGWFLTLVFLMPSLVTAMQGAGVIMQDLDGAFHGLGEYTGQGKWTVVMLWASDCPVCNQEIGAYVKFYEAHQGRDAAVVGISLDGAEKREDAGRFVTRHRVSFPNLIDEPRDVAQFYSAMTGQRWLGTPTFMVFAPDGARRGAQVGAVPPEVIEAFIARESVATQ